MKIDFSEDKKTLDMQFTKFDKFISFISILLVCITLVWCIAKPDFSKINITFPERVVEAEVEFTEGTSIDWDEYSRLAAMDEKYLKKYKKYKSMVTGYINNIPTEKNGDYYVVIITPDDTTVSSHIELRFSSKKKLEEVKPYVNKYASFSCEFDKANFHNYFYCTNPTLGSVYDENPNPVTKK